ncbi:hypothetical protein DK846_00615 [Methanospirillum lacunae]|uniref:Uncharacterized protein n=1 Tax=Methanospirillum lacunae TaxID=668570 RepID=A0A2V2NB51_9EURY|nr:hypothetical protein DK846_00615 [Methanospirillum lacunae]
MIPPIEERSNRPCYSADVTRRCVHCLVEEDGIVHCNFSMVGEPGYANILGDEKMPDFWEIKTQRYNLTEEQSKKQPCIYHLNQKEYSESMQGY